MSNPAEDLEHRIIQLRVAIRQATQRGDREHAQALRRELRAAERAWDEEIAAQEAPDEEAPYEDGQATEAVTALAKTKTLQAEASESLLPLREQVHEALTLLTVPAAPRLISAVHEAFFASTFPSAKLTSLKRDEERSFRTAPNARPYYICPALTADLLAPSRGLLAVSTWPMQKRVIGSLSPRVDFLTAAIQIAAAVERIPAPVPSARRLLWRFAASIPGAGEATAMPDRVITAAEAELSVHVDADTRTRKAAAQRARKQLSEAEQLFGIKVRALEGGRHGERRG